MSKINLNELNTLNKEQQKAALAGINKKLESMSAEQRIVWSLDNLSPNAVLSSSFGIQSAVSLHMITSKQPDIPVIFTDTGYMFLETYKFIDKLKEKLNLNLHIFSSKESPSWQEARYGKLWEKGIDGIKFYNYMNKVEPMNIALTTLGVGTWFAGLRRNQSDSRSNLPVLDIQRRVFKILPIVDWNNMQIYKYLKKYDLSYHPLWEHGYFSVGDVHTTRKLEPGMKEEETRFFGIKRECGLHED